MEGVDGQGINNNCLVGFDQAIVRNLLAIRLLHLTRWMRFAPFFEAN